MDCLYAECTPCITDCVMAELEKLGQKYRVALKIAKVGAIAARPVPGPGPAPAPCAPRCLRSRRHGAPLCQLSPGWLPACTSILGVLQCSCSGEEPQCCSSGWLREAHEQTGRACGFRSLPPQDPRIERLPCTHKGTYADDCICERVKQHRCYIVATCDRDLRRRIRKIAGVPIMFIQSHRWALPTRLPRRGMAAS